MVRESRDVLNRMGRNRQRTPLVPILVTGGCFALLVGVLYWAVNQSGPNDDIAQQSPQAENRVSVQVDQPASKESRPADKNQNASVENSGTTEAKPATDSVISTESQQSATVAPSPEDSKTQTDPTEARQARLQAQLDAGEFGPALETAQSAQDPEVRAHLFRKVAEAQAQIGEFDAALGAIRRIPDPETRTQAQKSRAREMALSGGGSMADFQTLISLIQQETEGPWEEVDGAGGTMSPYPTGVRVDPNGLIQQLSRKELNGRLDELGLQARKADLNQDVAQPSNLRLVSLTRLEEAVSKRLNQGQPVVESMKLLAGLTEIRYVFVYPESGEVVIGGPAEGWEYNENGLPVGINSRRPALQLDDLVVALRTFSPSGSGIFQCLITPREEGLKKLKRFVEASNARGPLRPSRVSSWVNQLQEKLGLQDVVINGVPQNSRIARVIAEADYRMKLIGVDKLDGGSGIPSIFDLLPLNLQKNPPALDALRWWLTMKYDALLHSPDRNVFEIQGSSVLCRSENQVVTDEGKRVSTGKAEATNRMFAENFTQHYAELAERDIVFADLQNIFDLSLVAALIRHEGLTERTGWDMGSFAPNGTYQPAVYPAPTTVESVVAHRVYNNRDIVVQVAGGVRADLMSVVNNDKIVQEVDRLKNMADEGRAPQLPEGRWWWDAAR